MKYIYPAVFTWHEDEKVYTVTFPDAENWFTDGYSLSEAMAYAKEVLTLMLSDAEECGDHIPKASKLEDIKLDDKNSFAQYIFADTELYREVLQLKKILDMKKRNKAKKFTRTTQNRRSNKIGNTDTGSR